MALITYLDRMIARLMGAASWLALPLVALLFLQWPLREIFRGYSREANDLGQIIFAIYVAISVTAATRAGTHLAADIMAQRYAAITRSRLYRVVLIFGVLPWALFVLIAGKSTVLLSVLLRESFQETGNPGYFIVKTAVWIMAVTMLAQLIVDIFRPAPPGEN